MMPLSAPISLVGTVCFLAAFGALNAGMFKSESYGYQTLNLIGAACFTYTAIQPFNPGLFITEFVWSIFGAYGIYKVYRTAVRRRSSSQVS